MNKGIKEYIEILNNISEFWFAGNKQNLNINSQKDIDTVHDIMNDFATLFIAGKLTEEDIKAIDPYYKAWYGYSLRQEDDGYD